MPNENPFEDALKEREDNPFDAALVEKFGEIQPPVEVEGRVLTGQFGGEPFGGFRELPPTRKQELEARDFDVDAEGGPISARLAAKFGDINDIRASLAEESGLNPEDFEVANVEKLGVVFKGPGDEKYRVLDPVGLDIGDIAAEGLNLIPMVAEIGVGLFSKNIGAAAAAGGTTRAGLLSALKYLEIVKDPDIAKEAAIEGGLALAGGAIPKVARFLSPERRAMEAVAGKGTAAQFRAGREELREVSEEVAGVTGVRPKFTVGEELGAVEPEQAAALVGAESVSDIGIATARGQRKAAEALKERFEQGVVPREGLAVDIVETQKKRVRTAKEKAEKVATESAEKVKADLNKISGMTSPQEIRATIEQGIKDVKKSLRTAYNSISTDAEFALVDLSGVGQVAKEIIKKVRVFKGAEDIFTKSLKAAKKAAKKPDTDLNSYQVMQEARSELRAHIRALRESKASGVQIKEAQKLEKEFSNAINDALTELDPNIAERLIETDLKYAAFKDQLDKGFVGRLVARKEGVSVVPDEALVKTILKSTSDTQRFINSVNDFFPDRSAINQLRDAFYAGYREKVLTGKVTHASYMGQIKDTGKLIFSKEELKVLGRAGTAKNRILVIEKKLAQRIKKINSTFNAKLVDRIEPHKLVDNVSKSPQKTAQLKRMLSPEEWGEYQGARRAKLVQNMTNNKGELTLDGVANALKKPDLRLSMGPKYVKDLQVAERYLKILAKKQKGIGEAKARAAVSEVDVARAMVFGPLSHTGFIITRLKGLGRDKTAKAMTRLLNDPELLAKRIEIFKSPKQKQLEQLQNLWGAVGLPLVLNQPGIDEQKSLKSFDKEQR